MSPGGAYSARANGNPLPGRREVTVGVNWQPHPNFVLRPEIKHNSGDALVNLGLPDESTIFGIDAILTF